MASGNPKKRKSLSPYLKNACLKKKKQTMESRSPPSMKKSLFAHDSKGCSILTKLIESGVVADHEPVFYLRKKDKSVMKEGAITREGVLCHCCNVVFLLSRFEVHAGSGLHRPSANMFLRDGRSLMQCQQAIDGVGEVRSESIHLKASNSPSSNEGSVSQAIDTHDSICQTCGDGGKLMLCDSCPSAYHAECLFLDMVPDGEWHCPRCRCGACGGSVYKISSRSMSPATTISSNPLAHKGTTYTGSLVLTELSCESSTVQDSAQTILSCAQCQASYHSGCMKGDYNQRAHDGHWFCTKHCKHVFRKLRKLVGHVFPLDRGLSWMILRSSKEDKDGVSSTSSCTGFEKRLSEASKVMHESFDPVIDYETGVDLLAQTLFNRKSELRRLDCSGFYTMLLLRGDELVAVATVRAHGRTLAEMPFIVTRNEFRQQGMCKILMQALEKMLRCVGVQKLILPSIDDLLETWRGPFGFKTMDKEGQKQVSGLVLLSFAGTTLLEKSLIRSEEVALAPNPVLNSNEEANARPAGLIRIRLKLSPPSKTASSTPPIGCH